MLSVCFSLISFKEFRTLNFPKVICSIVAVNLKEDYYVELTNIDSQKNVIASPSNSRDNFVKYLEFNGYFVNSNEQMGSIYSVCKGGATEYITFSVNSFYAKWIWK